MNTEELKDLLKLTVNRMTTDKASVRDTVTLNTITYDLFCEPHDVGKLIGPGGEMAKSLSIVFNELANKHDWRVVINVLKTKERAKDYKPFLLNPNYECHTDANLLAMLTGGRVRAVCVGMDATTFYARVAHAYTELELALTTIFAAIGQRQGRRLNVQLE